MDEIVKQAIAKWPNVPHCYGWLALDARGAWRMRDERAQANKLPGERIVNTALLGFINRNYTHDEQGRWYFQNGPQRVYINLEATPYVVRTDPQQGFVLQTGAALGQIDSAWMNEDGTLILQSGDIVAQVDDRDMAQCLGLLRMGETGELAASDEELLDWLVETAESPRPLHFRDGERRLPVQRIARAGLAAQCGFVSVPKPDPSQISDK
ncbi:DUF2946 family protein [Noviherbaspirillum sedimenti]|uniref:DUF2946 family protein n=1 Tax=Noviherbaspirillum sedimenti TaxID=2320865 RepID=A0A3A3G5N9_9BURK|nr:DUF2946 family protein [Noviherbaspirillum sedimenti]RJG03833.1 DUF2946 family protein [Noviherbaspirillum sedimenti]